MVTSIAILFSVLIFVSTASSSESSQAKITKRRSGIPSGPYVPSDIDSKTTDDPKAVSSFQLAGVWGILHPAETDAELVWLHDDGRFTMRRGNCGILVQGKWEHDWRELTLINPDEARDTFFITHVPNKNANFEYLVMLNTYNSSIFYVWQRIGKETEEGCS